MQKTVPFIYYTVFIAYFKLYELLYQWTIYSEQSDTSRD